MRELADVALNAAKMGGAGYADIRISRHRTQNIQTREDHVENVSSTESFGFGVRVLVDGTWGFAASHRLSRDVIAEVTRRAVAIARANKLAQRRAVTLAPVETYLDHWQSPILKNPFNIPVEKKIDLLLRINAEALRIKGAKYCSSFMLFFNEQKHFASTDGSFIQQDIVRSWPAFTVTATDTSTGEFQTRMVDTAPMGLGYEYVEASRLLELAPKMAEEAVRKLTARPVEPGKKDLVLHPSHLWLTIHESVGHPTELDRALGYEANYAGTSFLTPEKLGKLRFGSSKVTFKATKTTPGGLATCGYDDDGVQTVEWPLVKDGLFVDYQTTREQVTWPEYQQARKSAGLPEVQRSYGSAYADSWGSIPFQRMPNVHLEPGPDPLTPEELIAGVDDGLYVVGDASYSIDHQRYNFQFGGQAMFEIKKGKIGDMVKDGAYQATTQEFWNSCDGVCDQRFWEMGGSYFDGKGEPGQSNAVSHGCPPARFRKVNILNTRRKV